MDLDVTIIFSILHFEIKSLLFLSNKNIYDSHFNFVDTKKRIVFLKTYFNDSLISVTCEFQILETIKFLTKALSRVFDKEKI